MAEIGFYHLTRTSLIAALPPLLGKVMALGEKALILCSSDQQVATIDDALWLCDTPDWLPHGTAAAPHPEWQPVYIGSRETNPNNAAFLFLTFGAEAADSAAYKRIFDLFDGNDETAVAAARTRWKNAKSAGHTVVYWKQEEKGWVKAA